MNIFEMLKIPRNKRKIMTECPTCKLSMESHSTPELMDCCMKQVSSDASIDENDCPNCKHDIKKHSNKQLAECTIAYLKSEIS